MDFFQNDISFLLRERLTDQLRRSVDKVTARCLAGQSRLRRHVLPFRQNKLAAPAL
jgi:hypothetical protein